MYRLSVCLASCAVCMQACECGVRARVRFSVACMGAYVRVFVSACVRVSVARQHACVCTCQCCTPTCVRVLRACMCTCGVRLHISRLTFSSLVIRFPAVGYEIKGLQFIIELHPLSCQPPPAEPPAPAARGRPALPETTPHRRSATAPAIPLAPPPRRDFSPGIPTPPPNERPPTAGDCQPEVSRLRIPTDH